MILDTYHIVKLAYAPEYVKSWILFCQTLVWETLDIFARFELSISIW